MTSGGEDGNRTRLNGFAGRCITSLLPRQRNCLCALRPTLKTGAGEESRTLDLNLGKVALYQLSYSRIGAWLLLNRAAPTALRRIKKGSQLSFPLEFWSGRRVSNSRPQPWQGCALPTELLPHWSFYFLLLPSCCTASSLRWSGRRVSNSRPQPWQGCALPTELLPHTNRYFTAFYYRLPVLLYC